MNIKIIAVGKLKEDFYKKLEEEFLKRLSRFAKVSVVEVKDERIIDGEEHKARACEAERILSVISEKEHVIALAIDGKEFNSVSFAKHIKAIEKSDLTFVMGGSTGLDKRVYDRSDERLSFSKLTFSHRMMRGILLEQLFRAFKINCGEKYHK